MEIKFVEYWILYPAFHRWRTLRLRTWTFSWARALTLQTSAWSGITATRALYRLTSDPFQGWRQLIWKFFLTMFDGFRMFWTMTMWSLTWPSSFLSWLTWPRVFSTCTALTWDRMGTSSPQTVSLTPGGPSRWNNCKKLTLNTKCQVQQNLNLWGNDFSSQISDYGMPSFIVGQQREQESEDITYKRE